MASNKIYVADVGTGFEVDTKSDLATATTTNLLITKPDKTEKTWIGGKIGTIITYIIVTDDLDQPGEWILNSYVINPSGKWTGESVTFRVYAKGK